MITGLQVRMARAGLRWTAEELAEKTGLSWSTIQRMETDSATTRKASLAAVEKVFNAAGVEFVGSTGVLMRSRLAED